MTIGTKRSLQALRKMIAGFKKLAQQKGRSNEVTAEWSYTYRAADAAEGEPLDISEEEFNADPGSSFGHPRRGEYSARAVDNDGVVVFDESGLWVSEDGDIVKEDDTGFAGQLAAIAKATRETLSNAANSESRAERRASQAEARETRIRAELETAIDAQDGLRKERHAAELARQAADAEREEMRAQRDAAVADLEEMKRAGEELAPIAKAGVMRLYEILCKHFDEPALAIEKEGFEDACSLVMAHLLNTFVDVEGKRVMLALLLHYEQGLPWPPLRVAFFVAWGVYFASAPPMDWQPPPPKDEADEPAAQEKQVH